MRFGDIEKCNSLKKTDIQSVKIVLTCKAASRGPFRSALNDNLLACSRFWIPFIALISVYNCSTDQTMNQSMNGGML